MLRVSIRTNDYAELEDGPVAAFVFALVKRRAVLQLWRSFDGLEPAKAWATEREAELAAAGRPAGTQYQPGPVEELPPASVLAAWAKPIEAALRGAR